ncbi:MAG: transglutaminase-like domain-containing protein [Desulfuromonadales bacterium]|nr:transglutaminase-like domain-containing protein [Desulfuromonadales bacterium]
MKLLRLILIAFFIASPAFAATHAGNYNWSFDLSAHKAGEEASLWIPYPVSDANQQISQISWQGDYDEAAVYTDRVFGAPMLYVHWPKEAKQRKISLSFHAERNEQINRDFAKTEGAFDKRDYALYLAPTSLGPITGEVKKLADEITAGKSGILEKARAIYDWTVDNTYRDPQTRGCGFGDVTSLLRRPGGKCADISSIYVALARAAGVPSREVLGIRSGKTDHQDVSTWQHCWVEFYLPGYGWVPVDPADVRKAMLKQQLTLDDPKVAELRESFWGRVDPYRIRLSEGRDLQLNPPQQGPAINYLMYPFAQIGGVTLDWLDPTTFKYSIVWKE